jgi:lipopolysaccharide biosynthesis glycosyltransferase
MTNALVTVSDDKIDYFKYSKPLLKIYAKRIDADFVLIRDAVIKHPKFFHFEKFQMKELLDVYDRIAYIDSDTIIRLDTPNIFDFVEPDFFGAVYDVGDKNIYNNEHTKFGAANIRWLEKIFGSVGWIEGYINTGVMVFSKKHKNVFEYDRQLDKFKNNRLLEQDFINYKLKQTETKIEKLPTDFNRMSFGCKAEGYLVDGKPCWITHFAGHPKRMPIMEKYFYEIASSFLSNHFSVDD